MSDIIERLRAVRSVQPSTVRIATEAADLIEAVHILDEYRRVCWDGATLDLGASA